MLGRAVYNNGRQFDDLDELKEAPIYAWDSIELVTLQNLVGSMPRRVISVIEASGVLLLINLFFIFSSHVGHIISSLRNSTVLHEWMILR